MRVGGLGKVCGLVGGCIWDALLSMIVCGRGEVVGVGGRGSRQGAFRGGQGSRQGVGS